MKLYEVMYGANDYVVYKVTAPSTPEVYYGYSKNTNVRDEFLKGAKRQSDPDRGDVRMINAAGSEDDLHFDELDVFSDEVEAFLKRNELRADDSASITGPSNFPGDVYKRARLERPEAFPVPGINKLPRDMTAREAMANKLLDYAKVSTIAPKGTPQYKQIAADLDKLKYPVFKQKYSL